MKKDDTIRRAIDESLGSVRFNQSDMRAVLRAVRTQESVSRAPQRRRSRFVPALAAMMTVVVLAPLTVFALRTLRAGSSITTINPVTPLAQTTDGPGHRDVIAQPACTLYPAQTAAFTQDDAIRAARACFEAVCDTTVFSFDEYTVFAQKNGSEADGANYEVTMTSIYDNGCTFSVVVSGKDGSVLSHSTPRLATVPTHLNAQSEEIQQWYDKYGRYIFTWPLDMQAEFSRRYEGALLRTPREGEITVETLRKRAPLFADSLTQNGGTACVYPMLYDGSTFADGQARYLIYCFPGAEISEELPENYLLVTMLAADGAIESSELLPTSGL